jgi:hypothetical protein
METESGKYSSEHLGMMRLMIAIIIIIIVSIHVKKISLTILLYTFTYQSCVSCGAVYLLFPRRRRFHPIPFDAVTFGLIVGLPSLFCLILIGFGFGYFLWKYRRLPDPIEKLVCESGLKIDANRARKVYVSASSPEDKCYDYTD